MISKGYKKQLIVNAYNTQLLPIMEDKVKIGSINTIERTKNFLLFRIDESLLVDYKFKYNTIDNDIRWFWKYVTRPIYDYYSGNKLFHILDNINQISNKKHDIDKNKDYAEYLEDIYD